MSEQEREKAAYTREQMLEFVRLRRGIKGSHVENALGEAIEMIEQLIASGRERATAGEDGYSPVELDLKERARKSEIMHNGLQYVLGQVFCGALFEMRTAMRHARNDEHTLKVAIKEIESLRASTLADRLTATEWRRDALEAAAQIADRYPTDGSSIAADIRALLPTPPRQQDKQS